MAHLYNTDLDAFELYHKSIEEEAKTSILGGPALPALGHAVSGAIGSAASTAITYPLSLIVTRLQVQRQLKKLGHSSPHSEYSSIADAAKKIYENEGGLSGLFNGCGQDAAKSVVDSFLFFLAYNFVRDSRLKTRGTKRLPMHEELGTGMVAGAFSRLFTTPVQNIITRKQTAAMIAAGSSKKSPGLSVKEIAAQIREEKGLLGFWSGYSATLVLTLNPALTFLFHETLLRMLIKREKRQNPGSRVTFILAALSKAMASCLTYPFSLAKSRSQVSSKAPNAEPTESISEKDSAGSATKKTVKNVEKRTIFEMLVNIVHEEGIVGLYSGIEGEVLKGFFSHGLTMLLKERIHRVVVKLYYLVLRLMERYPAQSTGQSIKRRAQKFSKQGGEKIDQAVETIHGVYQHARDEALDVVDEIIPLDDDD